MGKIKKNENGKKYYPFEKIVEKGVVYQYIPFVESYKKGYVLIKVAVG